MAHDHNWIDVTTLKDLSQRFVCSGCDARRVDGALMGKDLELDAGKAAGGLARGDGWDGMRRFLTQMEEGRVR